MENTDVVQATVSRKKVFREDKLHYYQRWKKSGLSRSAFCRREGLRIPTFCKWIKQFEKNKKSEVSFIPLPIKEEKKVTDQSVEIQFPNGLRCRLSRRVDIEWIQQLIQALHHVTDH